MKHLKELVKHIKTNLDVNAIKRRVAAATRNEKDSKLYKMFCLMADEGLEENRALKNRLYGTENKVAYYNLQKRLYNELLAAISADITQTETKDRYFVMRIIAANHLRNAYTLWQQKLHRLALEEFKVALEFADQSLDRYFMAHLQHQILVLSTFFPDTINDIEHYHKMITTHLDILPTLNNLCLMHYKVRYVEHFAAGNTEANTIVKNALNVYGNMLATHKNPILRLQILNGIINCHERQKNKTDQLATIECWLKESSKIKNQTPEFIANQKLMEKRKAKLLGEKTKRCKSKAENILNEFFAINIKSATKQSIEKIMIKHPLQKESSSVFRDMV